MKLIPIRARCLEMRLRMWQGVRLVMQVACGVLRYRLMRWHRPPALADVPKPSTLYDGWRILGGKRAWGPNFPLSADLCAQHRLDYAAHKQCRKFPRMGCWGTGVPASAGGPTVIERPLRAEVRATIIHRTDPSDRHPVNGGKDDIRQANRRRFANNGATRISPTMTLPHRKKIRFGGSRPGRYHRIVGFYLLVRNKLLRNPAR